MDKNNMKHIVAATCTFYCFLNWPFYYRSKNGTLDACLEKYLSVLAEV